MSSGAGLTGSHDERRLFEHFVIAGLAENQPLERLKPSSEECGLRNTQPLAPITDIAVIFPSLGEKPPDGFDVIESTTLGYPADLNHGSIGQKSVFLCYKRGYNKLPLVDIGILDEGRGDKPMIDSNVVQTTPFGRCASVNNASQGIYLTYRRAPPNSSQSQFVVTDIKVILANKGEIPPHTYYKITKNLNKGLVGSDVFICYKKSQGTAKRLAYKPAVLDYFPRSDHSGEMEDFKLAQNVAMFCLPMGALIECWPTKCAPPDRSFSTFVLTDENGTKFYGSAVTFYEKYTKQLSEDQLEQLDLKSDEGGTVEDSGSNNDPADDILFYKNVSICLISRFPFFNSFKRFLFFLHRMSSTPSCSHPVPIERYISHLMYEVSFPTPRRPRVFMQLGAENISFDSHDDSQLPLNGAQLIDTLKYLGSENLMYLMLLALLEQKILIHSLRPWMLAAVAESVCALMFPFHWQCPYIPQCPLGLAGVLHAPLPFIAGVDSRYFELYEDPPDDVTCFDLDTSTISFSTVRATFKTSMLPKKPAKQLKSALEDIFGKLQKQDYSTNSKSDGGFIPVDQDLVKQRQRREFENEIHDAFLKFIASIMKGYQAFLRPIKGAPMTEHATDTGNLFDLDGFLRSRDRSSADFYKRFSETQSFMRFIEERSFVSDKNTYNAFFDDCIAKLTSAVEDGRDISGVQLLEPDTSHSHTTSTINALADTRTSMVFIPAPEPFLNQETGEELQFVYGIWSILFPLSLGAVILVEVFFTRTILSTKPYFVFNEALDMYSIKSDSDILSAYSNVIIFMGFCVICSIVCNFLSIMQLKLMKKNLSTIERNLLFSTLASSVIQCAAAGNTFLLQFDRNAIYGQIGQLLLPFFSDFLTISQPYILILMSSKVRNGMLKNFFGKESKASSLFVKTQGPQTGSRTSQVLQSRNI